MTLSSEFLAPSTIFAALERLGPCSPEALVCYLDITPDDTFVRLMNSLLERGVVVYRQPRPGASCRFSLAPWQPCRIPMAEFDHLTTWQASKIQELRRKHPDVFVTTHKIARFLECTQDQLRAFMARNPRPPEAPANGFSCKV